MASLNAIVRFLNKELNVKGIRDNSRNGLQVRVPKEIKRVGFAVDASLSTASKAKKAGLDLLIVHHGLFWKGQRDKTGLRQKNVGYLKRNKINLYAVHLPLDAHPLYGNNAVLAEVLGLKNARLLPDSVYGISIGFIGSLSKPLSLNALASRLKKAIKCSPVVLKANSRHVRKVAVVSGGGSESLVDAMREKADCFITGEAPHHVYHMANDLGINMILGGHYETETVGVKSLMPLLRRTFDVKTVFIDNRTNF